MLKTVKGNPVDLRLYLVTDYDLTQQLGRTELDVVKAAIAGGVTTVQLRDKKRSGRELYQVGWKLRDQCARLGVTFIVNDRLDLALALQADGLHLGQDDLPLEVARQVAGDKLFIGLSVANEAQAIAALQAGADYLGASPVFTSSTKPDAGSGMGLEQLGRICNMAKAKNVPVVGIGAINLQNIGEVIKSGASGAAVISAIVAAPDITHVSRRMRMKIEEVSAASLKPKEGSKYVGRK